MNLAIIVPTYNENENILELIKKIDQNLSVKNIDFKVFIVDDSNQNTILDYLGGIRSTCTYINSKKIKYMPKCTTFLLVNNQLNKIFAK